MSGSESSHISSFSLGFQRVPGHVPQNSASFKVFCVGEVVCWDKLLSPVMARVCKRLVLYHLSENGPIHSFSDIASILTSAFLFICF